LATEAQKHFNLEVFMKKSTLCCVAGMLAVLILALAPRTSAQDHQAQFSGVISDYSPSDTKGGPWEIRGTWYLEVVRDTRTANFRAALTMSDWGTTNNVFDPTQPGQNAHTHNIRLTNATVSWNMTDCPAFMPPTLTGFQVNGTVSLLTGNGSNAPFETNPPTSTLQICVTGGDAVPYSIERSNITLVFGGPAVSHFGSQAIHGVVRSAN
jgi:hypothetical protein